MRHLFLFYFLLGFSALGITQDEIIGTWKAIDDNSGKPKAIAEIYRDGDSFSGKIVELFRAPDKDQDPICKRCKGDNRGKKVI